MASGAFPVIDRVEEIRTSPSTALIRIVFRGPDSPPPGTRLVIGGRDAVHRLDALPSPSSGQPPVLTFSVRASVADAAVGFALELPGGGALPLPRPDDDHEELRRRLAEESAAREAAEQRFDRVRDEIGSAARVLERLRRERLQADEKRTRAEAEVEARAERQRNAETRAAAAAEARDAALVRATEAERLAFEHHAAATDRQRLADELATARTALDEAQADRDRAAEALAELETRSAKRQAELETRSAKRQAQLKSWSAEREAQQDAALADLRAQLEAARAALADAELRSESAAAAKAELDRHSTRLAELGGIARRRTRDLEVIEGRLAEVRGVIAARPAGGADAALAELRRRVSGAIARGAADVDEIHRRLLRMREQLERRGLPDRDVR